VSDTYTYSATSSALGEEPTVNKHSLSSSRIH
jgi:hypothetical protein